MIFLSLWHRTLNEKNPFFVKFYTLKCILQCGSRSLAKGGGGGGGFVFLALPFFLPPVNYCFLTKIKGGGKRAGSRALP